MNMVCILNKNMGALLKKVCFFCLTARLKFYINIVDK